MSKFLIDENLPLKVDVWRGPEFEFVTSAFQSESDTLIWEYARSNDLTVVTKDSDFSFRILVSSPPPRVIHFKVGNMRLRDFAGMIEGRWSSIEALSTTHKLVYVFSDRLEGVE